MIMPGRGRIERSIPFVKNAAAGRSVGVGGMAKDQATGGGSNGGAGANELDGGEVRVSETGEFKAAKWWMKNVDRASMTVVGGGDWRGSGMHLR